MGTGATEGMTASLGAAGGRAKVKEGEVSPGAAKTGVLTGKTGSMTGPAVMRPPAQTAWAAVMSARASDDRRIY